jgi:hypothetical protein
MDEKILKLPNSQRFGALRNGYLLRDQLGAVRMFRTREDAAQALREIRDLQEPPPLTQE